MKHGCTVTGAPKRFLPHSAFAMQFKNPHALSHSAPRMDFTCGNTKASELPAVGKCRRAGHRPVRQALPWPLLWGRVGGGGTQDSRARRLDASCGVAWGKMPTGKRTSHAPLLPPREAEGKDQRADPEICPR